MLDLMRKHARNWGMKLLLGIIIVVFIFYFGSMRNQNEASVLASFDGKAISNADFQREYENILDLYRSRLGSNFSEEMVKALNLKEQAVNNLIGKAIMMAEAEEFGIRVSDEELRNSILSYPAFQRDGLFDQRLYEQTLRMNRLTPEDFETRQRNTLVMSKLQDLIADGIHVSDREVFDIYRMQKEKINVAFLRLSSKDYREKVVPAPSALESYFKEHSKDFRIPEQIQVRYIAFPAADFASTAKIADDDIREYYTKNKTKFAKPGSPPPALAEVNDRIVAELRQAAGMARAAEEAKRAHDTIYQQENFKAYAAAKGIKVLTTPLFSARNIPQELGSLKDFSKDVFPLQPNELSRVLSDDRGYYLFQVAARKPSYIPNFQEIRPEVEGRYVEKEARVLCQKDADLLLERLKKGEAWNKITKEKKLPGGETGFILPASGSPALGFSEQLTNALAQLSEATPFPAKALPADGNFVIVRFKERSKFDDADFQSQKENMKNLLREFKKNEILSAWIEGRKLALTKEGRLKFNKDNVPG